MRTITAQSGQTIFDIALQAMGDIAGAFDILALNAFLRLDMAVPAGTIVFIPDTITNPQVVDYYQRNGIIPTSGLGEEVTLNSEDMINIIQTLNYDLSSGQATFEGVRLWNLKDTLTVQVNYSYTNGLPDLPTGLTFYLEQSLDGVNYSSIESANLDKALNTYTFNIENLQTNFVRGRIGFSIGTGSIHEIIFRT